MDHMVGGGYLPAAHRTAPGVYLDRYRERHTEIKPAPPFSIHGASLLRIGVASPPGRKRRVDIQSEMTLNETKDRNRP
jgi:hypothetical protein